MDGFKKQLSNSLQLRLSLRLTLVIVAVAVVAGLFSFLVAFNEAHELQDDTLRQVAALFDQKHLPLPHTGDGGRLNDSDEEARVIVQYLSMNPVYADAANTNPPLILPATLPDGIQTVTVKDEPFRVLIKTLASSERIVVAQETGIRDEIALDSALRTLIPFLVLVPILLLVVANLVRTLFKPIVSLSNEIDQRSDQALHSFETDDLPIEVRPFVIAINRLLERVSKSMETQRRFVADAAHELRSPLTALSLNAERLATADMSDSARLRLITLRQGIERERALLEQLLTLARAQTVAMETATSVSLQYIYRCVLEDLMPLAEAKHIDIGMETTADVHVLANALELITIVKNLVDNAIRYTPPGGKIDLAIQIISPNVVLQIADSGPGIPVTEYERVFDPFYRVLGNEATGSGLGLSIVQAIANHINAQISLAYTNELTCTGLCVKILIPMQLS